MKNLFKISILLVGMLFAFVSCLDDLDVSPTDPDTTTSDDVFEDPAAYKAFLAKLYAGLAITGQQGPAGQGDVSGIDEGFSEYLREYWYHQELTTDEAVIGWDDQTIKDFHWHAWTTNDNFVAAMYYRIFYQVALANEFLRETTTSKLNDRGESAQTKEEVAGFRLEARFLRALSYWHALDFYGDGVPFATENDDFGDFPVPKTKQELFNFIEMELQDIEEDITTVGTAEYGRADQGAVWMLMAKLYLNAEVYIEAPRYTECITYLDKITGSGAYSLVSDYAYLFMADNDMLPEIIFPIVYDAEHTRTWGGTTFIIHAAVGGDMAPADYGIDGGWGGTRTTSALVNKFADPTGATDARAMFFTDGQTLEIDDISNFQSGYAVTKFTNLTQSGGQGSNATHVDTDFPMFRLGDVYLMYAEAVQRGGAGNAATALQYINDLRERAYGDNSGNISSGDLTLDFILDERGRELYWECHRRTDLIRFGKFTGGDYLWPWKGNLADGRATEAKYNLFPLPAADVNANPNLSQNPNY